MRSKISCCNAALFRKTVVSFWPVWSVYAFVWALAMPIAMGGTISRAILHPDSGADIVYAVQGMPLQMGTFTGAVICAIFCCFAAMGAFSHLYTARSAGAFAALPLRRGTVFISVSLGGLLPLIAVNLAVFLASLTVEAAYGVLYLPALLQWLALISMQTLFFFGFAALCAQLTGSLIVLPFVYAVLNFTAYVVEWLVRSILSNFIFGFSSSGFTLDVLSPIVGIAQRCTVNSITEFNSLYNNYDVVGYQLSGCGICIVYAAAGLVLLAGSLLLYRRRRMETAGDVVAVCCLKPVFKYCLALGCALCIGSLLFAVIWSGYNYTGTPVYVLALIFFMLVGCFIGYFAAEMLMQKSFAVWNGRRRWLGYCAVSAVIIALTLSGEFDLFGYERYVPPSDAVASVSVQANGDAVVLSEPDNVRAMLALHADIIGDKAFHESKSENTCYLNLQYTLKNGMTVRRSYALSYSNDCETGDVRALQNLINCQEAIDCRKKLDYEITAENITYASVNYGVPGSGSNYAYQGLSLTAEEADDLYVTCILPDILDGSLGRIWIIYDEDYYKTVYACSISIECRARSENGSGDQYDYQYFYTVPTVDSFRTNAWLEQHGVILCTEGEMADEYAQQDSVTYALPA
jgi:ABC-2 type transport system permease protein